MFNLLFGFSGRIRRRDYALGLLGALLVVVLAGAFIVEITGMEFLAVDTRRPGAFVLATGARQLVAAGYVLLAWIQTALFLKRLHDVGEVNRQRFRWLKWFYF